MPNFGNASQIPGFLLLAVGLFFSLRTWIRFTRPPLPHSVPERSLPFGSVLVLVGLLLIPDLRRYWGLALVAEPYLIRLALATPQTVAEKWFTSGANVVRMYTGQRGSKTVELRLCRRGIFILKQAIRQDPATKASIPAGTIGRWREDNNGKIVLQCALGTALFEPAPGNPSAIVQTHGFPAYEIDPMLRLQEMELSETKVCA
jgi:hypothetical protein